jgi:hypothetical protein
MPVISRHAVRESLRRLYGALRHAFAVHSAHQGWTSEDDLLLDRVAEVIVRRGMAAPATMFLESMGPMNFLGSQALQFFSPIMECAFPAKEITHIARLLERRDTLSRLVTLIETKIVPQGAAAR